MFIVQPDSVQSSLLFAFYSQCIVDE